MKKMLCAFYMGIVKGRDKCCALNTCENCDTCKFRKTVEELQESRKNAEEILFAKGLKKVKKINPNGGEYITVESITADIEKSIENGEIPLF